ncbi:uncharacterized protein LOC121419539 [Lytechinus variegatus]|uniref:uncharacterized protein LOC121419539 n=1 Tax=Lytechinus variegatus TaxID=7654 RepID=UPI001BB0E310|nr:uncharacterized protein LOC121419539 [Lytechinus variegatus]
MLVGYKVTLMEHFYPKFSEYIKKMAIRAIARLELYAFFIIITLATAFLLVTADDDIPVDVVVVDVRPVFLRGHDGVLQCRFRGEPLAVFWLKGPDLASGTNLVTWYPPPRGVTVPAYATGRYNLTGDFSLVVHDVDDDDAGRYICRLSDFRGYILRNYTQATVKVPPQDPFPTIAQCSPESTGSGGNPCTQTIETGDATTELTCRVRGAPRGVVSLSWTRGDRTLSQQDLQRSPNPDGETEDLTRTIDATPSDDPYVCTAILPVTTRGDATISVIVNPAPIITTTELVTFNATNVVIDDPETTSSGKDVLDRTSKEISLDDLEHICWHVRGCRETVKPILRALYPRHEGVPNCKENSCDPGKPRNAEIKNDLQLMKAWKEHSMTTKPGYQEPKEDHKEGERVQMRQPTSRWICCCHKQPKYRHGDDKNEQQPMFSAQSEEVELGVERSSPNQMIQLCLALERAGKGAHGPDKEVYIQLAKTFFQIKDEYKRELDNEVIKEFALSITKQHYQNLAKATKISEDSIAEKNAEDLKAVYKTDVMLQEWVQEQKGSNYEVRCRLRQAAEQCNRQDIADIFITKEQSKFMAPVTSQQTSVTITNEQRQGDSKTKREKSGNDTPLAQQSANYENLARGTKGMQSDIPRKETSMPETKPAEKYVTGISREELCRIIRYGGRAALETYWRERFGNDKHKNLCATLSDHELICMLKPFTDSQHYDIVRQQSDSNPITFMKHLRQDEQIPRNILRQHLQNGAPQYACLLPKGKEYKIYDVELVELAYRLVLSDVYPFAKALDIGDEVLTRYKHKLGPKIIQHGTRTLLFEVKSSTDKGYDERLEIASALKVAGYLEEAKSIVFGFEIGLADEAEIEEKRVDPAKLAKELGVSDDSKPVGPDDREESCQSVLQRWRNIVRPSSFNHRMVLADALHNLGEKELALGIISGKFRNNVINSRVSKMLAKTILPEEVDKLNRVLGKELKKDLNPYDIITAWVTEKKFWGFFEKSPILLSNELLKAGFYPFAQEIMAGGWKGKEAIKQTPGDEAGDKKNEDSMSRDVTQADPDELKEKKETAKAGIQGEDVVSKKNDDNMTHNLKSMKEGPGTDE